MDKEKLHNQIHQITELSNTQTERLFPLISDYDKTDHAA